MPSLDDAKQLARQFDEATTNEGRWTRRVKVDDEDLHCLGVSFLWEDDHWVVIDHDEDDDAKAMKRWESIAVVWLGGADTAPLESILAKYAIAHTFGDNGLLWIVSASAASELKAEHDALKIVWTDG